MYLHINSQTYVSTLLLLLSHSIAFMYVYSLVVNGISDNHLIELLVRSEFLNLTAGYYAGFMERIFQIIFLLLPRNGSGKNLTYYQSN